MPSTCWWPSLRVTSAQLAALEAAFAAAEAREPVTRPPFTRAEWTRRVLLAEAAKEATNAR